MPKPKKNMPVFTSELDERQFWEHNDSTEYVDWNRAKQAVFANLKPSTQSISLRLPLALLEGIKVAANSRDVPYQSLIKIWLSEKLHEGHL